VGAAVGDALGMPLEFGPRQPAEHLVREMRGARLPAGSFTDDTEMALALAESLLAHRRLDPADLAQRFVAWYQAGPGDIGIHTSTVLSRIAAGEEWAMAAEAVQQQRPDSAGNGSVMRCWPVALAHWDNLDALLVDSRLQSQVTHPHPDCVAGSEFVNAVIYHLLHGVEPAAAVKQPREEHARRLAALPRYGDPDTTVGRFAALKAAQPPEALRKVIEAAPGRSREELVNSGWVRHTLESAVWGLLTTDSFEQAVVQVVNLGNDADTAGAVVGALAGAAYGLEAIPERWRAALRGEWPVRSERLWREQDLVALADRLVASTGERSHAR